MRTRAVLLAILASLVLFVSAGTLAGTMREDEDERAETPAAVLLRRSASPSIISRTDASAPGARSRGRRTPRLLVLRLSNRTQPSAPIRLCRLLC